MQLRPYQLKVKQEAYTEWENGNKNVCLVMPTGAGKTAVTANIVHEHKGNTCVIAHRQELVAQLSLALAREGVRHRIIGPSSIVKLCVRIHMEELGRSYFDPSANCAVAGVDTLVRRTTELSHWLPTVSLWVTDECFPAGTLIDGRPIEIINVGDFVTAFNEVTGDFEQREVLRLFKNKAPTFMIALSTENRTIRCTQSHPIWVQHKGWIEAYKVAPFDSVRVGDTWEEIEGRTQVLSENYCADGYVYNIEVEGLHTYIANGVVVHNCHHILNENKWGTATQLFPNAKGLGVTATPSRADGKGLGSDFDGVMDCLVIGPTMRELINNGYLTEYRIFAPPSDLDLSTVSVGSSGDYSRDSLTKATRKSHVMGDVVAHYLKIAKGKLGITFTTDVQSAKELAEQFTLAGVPAVSLDAKTPDSERIAVLRRFKNREIMQIVNVDLFSEGFDLPAIEVVSMARATQSYGMYVQVFGRALRPLQGKSHAIIIDHVGNVIRHGLPDAPRVWSLSRREARGKKTDPDAIPVKACVECTAVYERIYKACPYCGHEPIPAFRGTPEHVDGDLYELDAEVLARMRGEVAEATMTLEEKRLDLAMKHVPYAGQLGGVNKHEARLNALQALRDQMGWWGGYHSSLGRSDSEIQRRFYFKFGIDVLSAQALRTKDAIELSNKIAIDNSVNMPYNV